MVVATWDSRFKQLYKADAQRVADEIYSIGETATPKQIVALAKNEQTELHKCFEWNDSIAAEHYRIQQARDVVRHLVIKRPEENKEKPQNLRLFFKPVGSEGYRPTELIMKNENEYERLLETARAELHMFKKKYSMLTELEEILALID